MGNTKYNEEHINFIINRYKETKDINLVSYEFSNKYFVVTDNAIRIILCKHKCLDKCKKYDKSYFRTFNLYIVKLAKLFKKRELTIHNLLRNNKIDPKWFYEFITQQDLFNFRDEFYSLFKNELTADNLWTKIFESGFYNWDKRILEL